VSELIIMDTQPLKDDADKWSLASDAKLLEYLKQFSTSESLLSHTIPPIP
jgi:hypothetical protein